MNSDFPPYRIETLRKPGRVFLAGGQTLQGTFFLSPISPSHKGPETVLELLSGERSYLPFETDQGKVVLVQKTSIVKILLDEEPLDSPGPKKQTRITLWFVDQSSLKGQMCFLMPVSHSRVSDFLNSAGQFFYVHTNAGTYLVNQRYVSFVELLEEP